MQTDTSQLNQWITTSPDKIDSFNRQSNTSIIRFKSKNNFPFIVADHQCIARNIGHYYSHDITFTISLLLLSASCTIAHLLFFCYTWILPFPVCCATEKKDDKWIHQMQHKWKRENSNADEVVMWCTLLHNAQCMRQNDLMNCSSICQTKIRRKFPRMCDAAAAYSNRNTREVDAFSSFFFPQINDCVISQSLWCSMTAFELK